IAVRNAPNNRIGTDYDGVNDAAEGNVISGNLGTGVLIEDSEARGNTIAGNSIFANGGLGIDLGGDGVTANDPLDLDTGANELQNFPELTDGVVSGGTATVVGRLASAPNTTYRVEFFASAACNPSGFGEG